MQSLFASSYPTQNDQQKDPSSFISSLINNVSGNSIARRDSVASRGEADNYLDVSKDIQEMNSIKYAKNTYDKTKKSVSNSKVEKTLSKPSQSERSSQISDKNKQKIHNEIRLEKSQKMRESKLEYTNNHNTKSSYEDRVHSNKDRKSSYEEYNIQRVTPPAIKIQRQISKDSNLDAFDIPIKKKSTTEMEIENSGKSLSPKIKKLSTPTTNSQSNSTYKIQPSVSASKPKQNGILPTSQTNIASKNISKPPSSQTSQSRDQIKKPQTPSHLDTSRTLRPLNQAPNKHTTSQDKIRTSQTPPSSKNGGSNSTNNPKTVLSKPIVNKTSMTNSSNIKSSVSSKSSSNGASFSKSLSRPPSATPSSKPNSSQTPNKKPLIPNNSSLKSNVPKSGNVSSQLTKKPVTGNSLGNSSLNKSKQIVSKAPLTKNVVNSASKTSVSVKPNSTLGKRPLDRLPASKFEPNLIKKQKMTNVERSNTVNSFFKGKQKSKARRDSYDEDEYDEDDSFIADDDRDLEADKEMGMILHKYRVRAQKTKHLERDISNMDVGFDEIEREEKISRFIGREEDKRQFELIKKEQEDEFRQEQLKLQKKKKKLMID